MVVTTSLTNRTDADLEESQRSIVDGVSEALRSLAPKPLYDLLHMCITPCLDHLDLRGGYRRVSSCWRVEAMVESYDPAPTHPSGGLELSLEVKEGLRGWVYTVL